MATYRNKSDQELIVTLGVPSPRLVPPEATVEVPDELVENYDLNCNLVRVDTTPPAPAPQPAAE